MRLYLGRYLNWSDASSLVYCLVTDFVFSNQATNFNEMCETRTSNYAYPGEAQFCKLNLAKYIPKGYQCNSSIGPGGKKYNSGVNLFNLLLHIMLYEISF